MSITFHTSEVMLPQARAFRGAYNLLAIVNVTKSNKKLGKHHTQRTCRFCGRSYPDAKFKNDAHLIPELLGNKLLFSDVECSDCNHLFKLYDSDLANYMGIFRTLTGIKGKGKVPTFTSADQQIKVRHQEHLGNHKTIISREDVNNQAIKMDIEKGIMSIKYPDNPFIPKQVYKAILKVALSLFTDTVIASSYQRAIGFLMGKIDMTGCILRGFKFPHTVRFKPYVLLFEKKDPKANLHTHVMLLYAQNFIFQLPIPLHSNDVCMFDGQSQISVMYCPPLVGEGIKEIVGQPIFEDMSSNEKVYRRPGGIRFQMNKEDLANAAVYDQATGATESAKFNPLELVKVIIGDNIGPVNPAQLEKMINTNKDDKGQAKGI
jgi:hypothetical protein